RRARSARHPPCPLPPHALGGAGPGVARQPHRRSRSRPAALGAGWDRRPPALPPRPRPAARPVGPARGGRAGTGARDPRARSRDPPHAARAAPRHAGGAGSPLGAPPGVSLRPVSAGHVRSLTLEGVSFWYPATDSPALRNVSLHVARGE